MTWEELIARLAAEGKTLDYWKEYQHEHTDSDNSADADTTDTGDQAGFLYPES